MFISYYWIIYFKLLLKYKRTPTFQCLINCTVVKESRRKSSRGKLQHKKGFLFLNTRSYNVLIIRVTQNREKP